MATSLRELIIVGMVNALTAAQAQLGGATVSRSYRDLTPRAAAPLIVITPWQEEARPIQTSDIAGTDDCTLLVDVEVHVRGDPYDQVIDPIAVAVHQVLEAWAMTLTVTVGGKALPVLYSFRRDGATWESVAADKTAGVLTMRFRARYLADAGDISLLPRG